MGVFFKKNSPSLVVTLRALRVRESGALCGGPSRAAFSAQWGCGSIYHVPRPCFFAGFFQVFLNGFFLVARNREKKQHFKKHDLKKSPFAKKLGCSRCTRRAGVRRMRRGRLRRGLDNAHPLGGLPAAKVESAKNRARPPQRAEIALTVRPQRALCLNRFTAGLRVRQGRKASLPAFPAPSLTVADATGENVCKRRGDCRNPLKEESRERPPNKGGASFAFNPRRSVSPSTCAPVFRNNRPTAKARAPRRLFLPLVYFSSPDTTRGTDFIAAARDT